MQVFYAYIYTRYFACKIFKKAHPDTAATGHFLPLGYKGKILPNENIEVICANGASMHSVGTQELDLPSLPANAKKAHTFKEMDKALSSVP